MLVGLGLVAFATNACTSDYAPSQQTASTDDSGTSAEAGGQCCPPSSTPACCMEYGGWSPGASCGKVCDGMPLATDPGWKLGTDDRGCAVWTNPNDRFCDGTSNPSSKYCGGVREVDAGADASDDGG